MCLNSIEYSNFWSLYSCFRFVYLLTITYVKKVINYIINVFLGIADNITQANIVSC